LVPDDCSSSDGKHLDFVRLLMQWHKENRRDFPWRTRRDPFTALLAEILLQRTPASRVAGFFPSFIEKFPTPLSIATTDLKELENVLQPMGLKKRASWLTELMKKICREYNGEIPDREDELMKLPGVGLYTARAVLSFGFKKDVAIVDVNVARVLSRVFDASSGKQRPSEDVGLWAFAAELVPKGSGLDYNEALLDHASLVCKKQPLCDLCPVSRLCNYYSRSRISNRKNSKETQKMPKTRGKTGLGCRVT